MNKSEAIKTRTIQFVFSDESRDAHGTILPVEGWVLDRFNKNGIAFFNHNSWSSDPNQAIGNAKAWVEGRQLVGEIRFEEPELNPLADTIFKKVLAGTYRTVSVGFIPLERGAFGQGEEAAGGERETYYYGKRELLEISIAPLPSNSNALVRSLGAEPIGEKIERMSIECEFRAFDPDTPPDDHTEEEEQRELECTRDAARVAEALAAATIAKAICKI